MVALRDNFAHGDEAVDLAGKAAPPDRHAGVHETPAIGLTLVMQRIEAGRRYISWRDPLSDREPVAVTPANPRVRCRHADIAAETSASGHERAAADPRAWPTRMLDGKIGRRIRQNLECQLRLSCVTCHQRERRRDIPAGAVAADRDPRCIQLEARALAHDERERRPAVLDGSRETMLRCQTIVDRDHRAARDGGDGAAHDVVVSRPPDTQPPE